MNTEIASRLTNLKTKIGNLDQPVYWKPKIGEIIAGIIITRGFFTHPSFGRQETIILKTVDGVYSVILSKYLLQGLESQNGQVGDLCAIAFHGKEAISETVKINKYTMLIEKA